MANTKTEFDVEITLPTVAKLISEWIRNEGFLPDYPHNFDIDINFAWTTIKVDDSAFGSKLTIKSIVAHVTTEPLDDQEET